MLSAAERAGAGEGTVPGQGAASPTPAGKDMAEEELAGSPGWEVRKPGAQAVPGGGEGGGWGSPNVTGPDCTLEQLVWS